MPDLLLELFSEEIPARMQLQAAEDLRRLVTDRLVEAGLTYEGAKAFVTPRRLALTVHGLNARSADVTEEKKGPRVGAPEKAIEGFLRGAGLASIGEAKIEKDPKRGDFYVARVTKPGRAAEEIIAATVPSVIRDFPWPKSMRWGARSAPSDSPFAGNDAEGTSSLRWVRPLRSILCTFGPETEEPVVIDFEVAGIAAGNVTFGHRFLRGGEPIVVRRFDDYQPKLEAAKVVLDHERRQAIIEAEAKHLAFAQGLELVEDKGLLEEVAGLVEWPVVLMGKFDEKFLAIPEEVIRLTIRQNQKCFVVRASRLAPLAPQHEDVGGAVSNSPQGEGVGDATTKAPHGEVRARSASLEPSLTDRFILVSNIEASDGGTEIIAGNERVIAARLSDARFFWEQDLKIPLEAHARKLATITFHEKLGSQAERVERIARLARELAPIVGANPDDAERAARLAKADLTSGMVGEFPELQGVMGRYYALAQGEKPAVAEAIRDHYKPQGPNDCVPSEPLSVAVALADKLDTLVGFWAIDEKPTGSKDPYALRRAALGVIRLVLKAQLPLVLVEIVRWHLINGYNLSYEQYADRVTDLSNFAQDRLAQVARDEGSRHDYLESVLDVQSLTSGGKITSIVHRVEALGRFLGTDDGKNLLVGYRRAANIVSAEEKKDRANYDEPPDHRLIEEKGQAEEKALFHVMQAAETHAREHVEREDFEGAMRALAELRPAVDAFFDKVTVNADDPELRKNRLKLLNMLRRATLAVADFSRIGG